MLVCLEEEEGREYIEEVGEEVVIVPSLGHVPVVDSVDCLAAEEEKKGDHLLAAFSYWCQGKPGGCHIDSSLTGCDQLRVSWHEEEDYNSREIPCPSYRHGALEKKFSECNHYSNCQAGDHLTCSPFGEHVLHQDCGARILVRGAQPMLGLSIHQNIQNIFAQDFAKNWI